MCLLREGLLVFNVHMPSMRKGFYNMFLEECLVSFKMYGDGKKYICFVRYGVCKIDEIYMWEVGMDSLWGMCL